MEIADEEYQQFINYKNHLSLSLIENLEDDIDAPIRKCIAMWGLLQCKPLWSCCGFDYKGQPFHKSHQYGRPFIILGLNEYSYNLLLDFIQTPFGKICGVKKENRDGLDCITLQLLPHQHEWNNSKSIHVQEIGNTFIMRMEGFLLDYKDNFLESVIIEDTNNHYKRINKHWQYEPKRAWKVYKSNLSDYG